ncbi:hypothetical protein HanXRQr2_Chr10g0452521 [Helianthus annuus]|uniref:DUF4283 domain-containing protein n=1 Tax=Helianthus annuus TaxID=4232 RepID=A0A9K3N5P1_HELAN|nr:hypothetical protein HanXRQr2_Chr10g0452521 [Helianthus annuus]
MGDYKLKINVARFAVENSGVNVEKEGKVNNLRQAGQSSYGGIFNVRDVRSYKEVVGSSKLGGGPKEQNVGRQEFDQRMEERFIVVPDRSGAFKNLHGLALVGRTKNLEILVDFDKLLRIVNITVAHFQYLGGLSLLITFHDEDWLRRFLDLKDIWNLWFSKLDPWNGQTLPLERVAWLKLCGIPLHLLDGDVLSQVGELFGKDLFVPKSFEEDQDLSFARVGVLVGQSRRIVEEVEVKWKDKSFRIWAASASASTPVEGMQVSGDEEFVAAQGAGGGGEDEKSPEFTGSCSKADPPNVHGENSFRAHNNDEEREGSLLGSQGFQLGSRGVGPMLVGAFKSESGEKVGRPKRRCNLGQRKSRAQVHPSVNNSPEDLRPKKISRSLMEHNSHGFGFVGFTSHRLTPLDLNTSAPSSEPQDGVSADPEDQVKGSKEDEQRHLMGAEEEVVNIISIGAKVGIEFGQEVEQVSKIIGLSGNNGVEL